MVAVARELSIVEAAYLASACLAQERHAPESSTPNRALLDAALRFDPNDAPVSVRSVRFAIDEGVIKSWNKGVIVLDETAVFYVASIRLLNAAAELTPQAKVLLYKALMTGATSVVLAPHLSFGSGAFVRACRRLLDLYSARVLDWVVTDSDVMGGLPCIRGTRIPVHTVLGRIEEGESFEDLVKDFDHVSPDGLEAAITYARTHPRRGRPKRFR